jgi:hypothetical protein
MIQSNQSPNQSIRNNNIPNYEMAHLDQQIRGMLKYKRSSAHKTRAPTITSPAFNDAYQTSLPSSLFLS